MALTPSTMLPLGTKAPDFQLPDTLSGQLMSLQSIASDKATVVMFISNHCPYVVHIRDKIVELAKDYQAKGVSFVAISANDVDNYPNDSPENMTRLAKELHFSFPYLYDESQDIASAYQAACTPDFYIFDGALNCVYRGRFDNATPGNNVPVTGADLSCALDAILNDSAVPEPQIPSMGCNIKWK